MLSYFQMIDQICYILWDGSDFLLKNYRLDCTSDKVSWNKKDIAVLFMPHLVN